MEKLFESVSKIFSRFYEGIVPSDELALKLWEDYEIRYKLDTTK